MSTVVILGAGDLGGALARHLAAGGAVSRIALVDDLGSVAAGKALDVSQAGPVDRYTTALSGGSDVSTVVGASVVVFADRAGATPAEWSDQAGLALLKRVAGLNQVAPLLCAGAMQAGLVERGVSELGVSRMRLLGSAPEALRAAVVMAVALEAGAAPQDVSLSVVGRPPHAVIVPWEAAAIGGRLATCVLSAAQLARLDARVARLWPPGPITLAAAAARMIHTALARTGRTHMATVALTKEEGTPGRAAMLPVTLDPAGISQLVAPSLSSRDRVRLDTTLHS